MSGKEVSLQLTAARSLVHDDSRPITSASQAGETHFRARGCGEAELLRGTASIIIEATLKAAKMVVGGLTRSDCC